MKFKNFKTEQKQRSGPTLGKNSVVKFITKSDFSQNPGTFMWLLRIKEFFLIIQSIQYSVYIYILKVAPSFFFSYLLVFGMQAKTYHRKGYLRINTHSALHTLSYLLLLLQSVKNASYYTGDILDSQC